MTKKDVNDELIDAVGKHAYVLGGALSDYDPILDAAKDRHLVLIGEASHGTHEFYKSRAEITQRLIDELEFDAVIVEADWPDAYRVNRYVSSRQSETGADQALQDFERFPTWMWRNLDVKAFIEWLYAYNLSCRIDGNDLTRTIGFYGLDLYSMSTSIHAVIDYLEKVDPRAAKQARVRYSCLDHFMDQPQAYAYATEYGLAESCEREIVSQLVDLRKRAFEYLQQDGLVARDEFFCAEQNAKLVKNAEQYYCSMYRAASSSWNIRDKHMFETLQDLSAHLSDELQREARIVVWAHNSHIGNAAATEMNSRGDINIGQLVREQYHDDALLVGFSTCRGFVTAASDWDAPIERKQIREPIAGSYEDVFHHVNYKQFMLDLRDANKATDLLMEPRLQRAIGVIYRPETERQSHYFYSCLPEQFDFLLHYDVTDSVKPIETTPHLHRGELDETFPTGL